MYGGVAQNPMAMNGFGTGGFPGFGNMNTGAAGYPQNGNSLGAYGSNAPMNGMGQTSPLDQMMSQLTSAMMMMTQMLMLQQMQAMMSSMANFGQGTQGGGTNGISDFLGGSSGGANSAGGSSGGASSVGGSSAPAATSSDFGSVPAWGGALAKDAEKNANGPGGYCFRWVRQALERAGVKGVGGASAYMAADQLAKNPKFREIKVDPKDLAKLPAGAVVVWDRGGSGASSAGKTHGHISISLGDGREASDRIRKQITGIGSNVRVFLPK